MADSHEFSEKLENMTVYPENEQYQIDFIMEYFNYFFGDYEVNEIKIKNILYDRKTLMII